MEYNRADSPSFCNHFCCDVYCRLSLRLVPSHRQKYNNLVRNLHRDLCAYVGRLYALLQKTDKKNQRGSVEAGFKIQRYRNELHQQDRGLSLQKSNPAFSGEGQKEVQKLSRVKANLPDYNDEPGCVEQSS